MEEEKDWTKGLKICGGLAIGLIALQRLVESCKEPECKKIFIPEDVCEIKFDTCKPDHSEFQKFKTTRDEDVILHFKRGSLVSLELLSDKKPCQSFEKEEKK